MTSETALPAHSTQLTAPTSHFAMRFTSTWRGARLARLLATQRLDAWGLPYNTEAHDTLTLIVAELCANAVLHGHVPGRDFQLRLAADAGTVRVEVTDTRTERLPAPADGDPASETGHGLLLVAALATRWDWHLRTEGPGKTIWAELLLRGGTPSPASTPSRGVERVLH
ncbi:ATP-binding protein [Streptomyces sp. NPDC058690]|uniref:ATP-binding protein n=1 Tax=unclassified Streptomyces TaxID=2593676 RepID=UPI003664F6E7